MAREKVQDYSEIPTIRFGEEDGEMGVGVEFAGYYKGCKVANTKYGEKKVHIFQTPEGDVQTWGSTMLDRKLAQVGVGNMTFVTYDGLGKKERGKNPAKLFSVEQDKKDTIHVDVPKVSFRDEEEADLDSEDDVQDATPTPLAARAAVPKSAPVAASAERTARINALIGRK
jgi:hypothetical protein